MRCDNCKFWKNITSYGIGECNKLKDKVDVDLIEGWDGAYLNTFETEDDFGCILFEEKSK
jgi:hypothetical protein